MYRSKSSWRFANSYVWFKRRFKRVGCMTSIWQSPDAGRNGKGKGKGKGKKREGWREGGREGGREERREEGRSACYWNIRKLKTLPKRISAKLTVRLLVVGNVTQNDGYFSIGSSSKFHPFLASNLFHRFWSAYFSLQNVIYHTSLKKRKWKLSPYFYWKQVCHCCGNIIHTNCVLSGTAIWGKLIGSFKGKERPHQLQRPRHPKIWEGNLSKIIPRSGNI